MRLNRKWCNPRSLGTLLIPQVTLCVKAEAGSQDPKTNAPWWLAGVFGFLAFHRTSESELLAVDKHLVPFWRQGREFQFPMPAPSCSRWYRWLHFSAWPQRGSMDSEESLKGLSLGPWVPWLCTHSELRLTWVLRRL